MYMDVTGLKSNWNDILKKYVNNKSLYIIIIIGIVFMLFSGGEETQKDNIKQNYDAYTDEARLKEILSKIDGVGNVHVMVTYYGTTTSDIASRNGLPVIDTVTLDAPASKLFQMYSQTASLQSFVIPARSKLSLLRATCHCIVIPPNCRKRW